MDDTENLNAEAFTPEEQAYLDSQGEAEEAPAPKAEAPKDELKADPEPGADTLEGGEKEPDVEKLVKHGAFEEERQRRKKIQQELQAEREEKARLLGQLEALRGGKQPEAKPEPQKIDWDTDPIAAGKALQAELEQRRQAEQSSAQVETIIRAGQADCAEFAKTEPQFFGTMNAETKQFEPGAYEFLRQATAEKLAKQGVAPEDLARAVDLAEIRLINDSKAMGVSAAAAMWHWAQIAGFKPRSAAAPSQQRGDNGQFKSEKSEAEKIANIEKAQKAGKSLGSVPAGNGEGALTLEALADMDEDEFAAATAGKKWGKLHSNGVI